ncbi:thiol reductant ABC exporter subunit CydC [Fastidiosibacter lacustris]|uniref:thiol reductant ABC exporter subunit CydC n=1 Tax=Fastidiosibacter lacustris TaxID=2056695 RepID=UPI000E347CC7|nr:thiol reductant ABC exporter subunit CydC [Fastidiosibacter lacustris]
MRELIPFLSLFKNQAKWMFIGTGLAFLAILASIGLLSLSGWFISATGFVAISSYAVMQEFNYFYPAAGVRTFSLFRIVTRYGERVFTHEATFKILTDVRVWVYQKLTPLAPVHLTQYKSGDLLNRLVNDVNALDNLYIRIISPSCVLFLSILVIGIFFSFFSIGLAITTMLLACVAGFFIPVGVGTLSAKYAANLAQESAELKTAITEHIQSLAELKVFAAEDKHNKLIQIQNMSLIQSQQKMSCYTGLSAALMTLFLGLTLWFGVWIAVGLVHSGHLNGAFIALIALAIMGLFEAIMPLPVAYQYLGGTLTSAKRLLQIIDQKPTVSFPEGSSDKKPVDNSIHFEDIDFCYQNRTKIYHRFNLALKPNEKVVLFGTTGCGKSTLVNLLARFFVPQKGCILIGGVDISKLSENQLRQQMTIITQQPHIFNGSIRNNLLLANEGATDDMLWDALDVVDLKIFVATLANGLDTWVGEHGKHLSKGQKRRLSLAQAVLSHNPILVLDEPTEGLDKVTEDRVIKALKTVMDNKTVILITHSRKLLTYVDRVIYL